jgi:hypothetical protein
VTDPKAGASSDVKFGEPPAPSNRAPYDWAAIAEKLRKKPGKWALIFEQDKTSYVVSLRQDGVTALLPSKGFEIRTANNKRTPVRVCDLWLRYNPEKDRSND